MSKKEKKKEGRLQGRVGNLQVWPGVPPVDPQMTEIWRKWLLWKMDSVASHLAELAALPRLRPQPQILYRFPSPALLQGDVRGGEVARDDSSC